MVADRRQPGLLDQATEGDAERQVHRDRPRVLDEDQVEVVHVDPVAQDRHKEVGQALDLGTNGTRVALGVEGRGRGTGGRWPREVHRRHKASLVAERVDLARAEAQLVAHLVQDGLPLGRLERDAVHASQPCGRNPDLHAPILSNGDR